MKSFNNIGFTLIELIVSVLISSILLMSIFYFVSTNIEEIVGSSDKVDFYNELFDFRQNFSSIFNNYDSGTILVNNTFVSGSDVILLTSSTNNGGYIFGVVSKNDMKLETGSVNYNKYYDKVLGYARLSSSEISNIYSNTGNVYNLPFNSDHLYNSLKIKDFQSDFYNSGSIANMDISFLLDYNVSFESEKWSDLSGIDLFKISLNF